jgi:hypothetical protein
MQHTVITFEYPAASSNLSSYTIQESLCTAFTKKPIKRGPSVDAQAVSGNHPLPHEKNSLGGKPGEPCADGNIALAG